MGDVRYDTTVTDERDLARVASRVGDSLGDGYALVVGGSMSVAGQLARIAERRVFSYDYDGCDPSELADFYAPYEDRSRFVAAVDGDRVVAAGRTVLSASVHAPLEIERHLGLDPAALRSEHCVDGLLWETMTIAAEPEVRSSPVAGAVIGEIVVQQMLGSPVPTPAVAAMRRTFFRCLQFLGVEIQLLTGGTFDYFGVPSVGALIAPGPHPDIRTTGVFAALGQGFLSRTQRVPEPAPVIELDDQVGVDQI